MVSKETHLILRWLRQYKFNMKNDLRIIGSCGTIKRDVAASATRYEVGEPMIAASWTNTSGAGSANVYTLAATDVGVVDTDNFGGVAMSRCLPFGTGTVVAHKMVCACPIGPSERIRGKGETVASINTEAKILALVTDSLLIDYNSTGGVDGGELYTIQVAPAADINAFKCIDGDPVRGTLDVWCPQDAYISVSDLA